MSYLSDTYDAAGRDFDRYDRREAEADDWERTVHDAAVELDNSAYRKLEELCAELRTIAAILPDDAARQHLVRCLVKYQP